MTNSKIAREKILIIDDEIIVAMALAEDLEAMGYSVIGPYGNTEDAERKLDEDWPDAAVLDINLGRNRTSFDLAAKLQDRGTPFLFLTGYSRLGNDTDRFAKTPRLGKPVTGEQVAADLNALLSNAA